MEHLQISKKWKALFFLASFLSPLNGYAAELYLARSRALCELGIKSFEKNLHPILRKDCARCHDAGSVGPPHSVAGVQASYSFVISYINWQKVEESKLVKKAAEAHWLAYPHVPGADPTLTESGAIEAIRHWWEEGQKTCPSFGNAVSKPVDLGEIPITWKKIPVRLPSDAPTLKSGALSLEFRKEGNRLFVRKPRFESVDSFVKISSIYLSLNNQLFDTPLMLVSGVAGKGAMLSGTTTVIPDMPENITLSVGFETLKPTMPFQCQNVEHFQKAILPVLEVRACYECHAGSQNSLAKASLNMEGSDPEVCSSFLQRAIGKYTVESPLITYPLRGSNGHPIRIPNQLEILPAWVEWVKSEKVHDF